MQGFHRHAFAFQQLRLSAGKVTGTLETMRIITVVKKLFLAGKTLRLAIVHSAPTIPRGNFGRSMVSQDSPVKQKKLVVTKIFIGRNGHSTAQNFYGSLPYPPLRPGCGKPLSDPISGQLPCAPAGKPARCRAVLT